MSETLVVKSVAGPNERGWYNVELEDGRTADTKNEAIAKKAMTIRGKEVSGVVNERQKGNFTNYFLNELDGVADERPSGNGATSRRTTRAVTAPRNTQQDDRQRVIEREWAYGRAVELLMASGEEFSLPLDEAVISKLDSTAETLLSKIH